MKTLQKKNREIRQCFFSLLHCIPWSLYLGLTILYGSISFCISAKFFANAVTIKEAFYFYWSCPLSRNLLFAVTFYISSFMPVLFILRFLDYNLCPEYYLTRLSSPRILVVSKILCVIVLATANVALRLGIFHLGIEILYPSIPGGFLILLETSMELLLNAVTFALVAMLLYYLSKNATIVFVGLTALLLFSLFYVQPVIRTVIFSIYGMNLTNRQPWFLYGDLLLLFFVTSLLMILRFDILLEEDEKNE